MAKLTLQDLTSLENQQSAVASINSNNSAIETALENTLSRDGTSPNSMGASLDMNNNRILNLPEPVADQEPFRKGDFDDFLDDTTAALEASVQEILDDTEAARDAAAASASAASSSASAASTSEGNAATSESNAAASEANVEALYDSFDDRYLGSKASDPVLDNDGNALVTGALYFNTSSGEMRVYDGASWLVAYNPALGSVDSVFGRTGAVVAATSDYDASQVDNDSTVVGTSVKDALNTLLADKVKGPASSVDNTLPRYDSTTGKLIKTTGIVVDGSDNLTTGGSLIVGSSNTITNINKGNIELANSSAAYIDFKDAAADDYDVRIIYSTGGTTLDVVNGGGTGALKSASSLVLTEATGIAQGLHTIWMPASAMIARTTNGAASGSVETTTNKVMIKTLDFDTSTQEFAQFSIFMPKSWNKSTITFQPVWSHASTTTNFGVVWSLAAQAVSDDDALDTAYGTAQTSTDTGGTTNDLYVGPVSSAITVAGTPANGDQVLFQVARVPSDGSDTMAIDARLHGVRIFYTVNAKDDT